jgi:adenylate cyclase
MGDGLVAVFGASRALEDHALRACRAALDMQYAARATTAAMRQIEATQIMIRVGLNSGEVASSVARGPITTPRDRSFTSPRGWSKRLSLARFS